MDIISILVCRCQRLMLRARHVKFGKNLKLRGWTRWKLGRGCSLVIGDDFVSNSRQKDTIDTQSCSKIFLSPGARLIIGNHSGMSSTSIQCTGNIEIGNNVIFGAGCLVMDSDFHSLSWQDRRDGKLGSNEAVSKDIKIGNDCFIGARSIICKGVTIGERVIIAAGSVITTDIPSDEVWGGNPAAFIRSNK